ncbi:MAG: hypothetical protein LBO63_06885 [Oscillospiraceae bacterium]|jgi:hypothetical protein|nr:hypothetical protein [Oscillospiraceae bacterium]
MSAEKEFTKENLDRYLTELGKEYRKRGGAAMPAEIILIGGAAVLANYGFRETTYDIDAIIHASSVMKEAVNIVGDSLKLPNGWLNTDFTRTTSYSGKLSEVSMYYKSFSKVLTVRTIAAEYLIAMKLMSGRQYKHDLSDVAGILLEHQRNGTPIARDAVDKAIAVLYGESAKIPDAAAQFIEDCFESGDYERVYSEIRKSEKQAREILLSVEKDNISELKDDKLGAILSAARKKRRTEQDREA